MSSFFLQTIGKANHKTPIVSETECCIDSWTVWNNDLFIMSVCLLWVMDALLSFVFLFTSSLLNQKIWLLFALPVELQVSVYITIHLTLSDYANIYTTHI